MVGYPCRMQPEKIGILRDDHSSVLGCSLQMPNILGPLQAEILNGGDLYAAPPQSLSHSFRYMLVQIELNLISHRAFHSALR